jgi:hypothetical protein
VGHGRLIFARFGKYWGFFSVADLFIVNAVTILVEFIGVQQALSFFGIPGWCAVLVSAAVLFAVMAGRGYRYWERFLIALVMAAVLPAVERGRQADHPALDQLRAARHGHRRAARGGRRGGADGRLRLRSRAHQRVRRLHRADQYRRGAAAAHRPWRRDPAPGWRPSRARRSAARRIGLLVLRGYIVFAVVIMALKLVQVAVGR